MTRPLDCADIITILTAEGWAPEPPRPGGSGAALSAPDGLMRLELEPGATYLHHALDQAAQFPMVETHGPIPAAAILAALRAQLPQCRHEERGSYATGEPGREDCECPCPEWFAYLTDLGFTRDVDDPDSEDFYAGTDLCTFVHRLHGNLAVTAEPSADAEHASWQFRLIGESAGREGWSIDVSDVASRDVVVSFARTALTLAAGPPSCRA